MTDPRNDLEYVFTEDNTASIRAAEEKRETLSDTEANLLRLKLKTDLFYLGKTVLGHKDYSKHLHGSLSVWNGETSSDQYRIILLPRSHFKSSEMTIADSVQIILPDDSGNQPYPRNLGPNCRLAIGHEVLEQASRFLAPVTHAFRFNEFVLALFPECVPGKKHIINKYELELPRDQSWPEPTVDTMGVGTRGQGRHYNYIKLDDIYGTEATGSKAAHDAVVDWVDNIQAFLTTPKTDHIDFIGTRYKSDDVYAHILDRYESGGLKKYIKPFWTINSLGEKEIIFPERFDWKSVEILRKNPLKWNAQYMNNPLRGDTEFKQEWERYYERKISDRTGIVTDVITFGETGSKKISVMDMDRILFVDPATVGNSGLILTGTDSSVQPKVFVLMEQQAALNPHQLIDRIFKLVEQYSPRLVVIEEVLFSVLYQGWLAREQQVRGIHFRIEGAKTKQKAKEDRVRGLVNWFANGQILMHASMEDLIYQFRHFGSVKEYHILDALAYGPRYWRASAGNETIEARDDAMTKMKLMVGSNGYSEIKYK